MLALGLVLAGIGTAAALIGLFSDDGRYIGWHIGTHTSLLIGVVATMAILVGIRLIRWGAVRGAKNAWARRKVEKVTEEPRD